MQVGPGRQSVGHPTVMEDLSAWGAVEYCHLAWDSVWFQEEEEQALEQKQKQAQAAGAGGWTALARLAARIVDGAEVGRGRGRGREREGDWDQDGRQALALALVALALAQSHARRLGRAGVAVPAEDDSAAGHAASACAWREERGCPGCDGQGCQGCETTTCPSHPACRWPARKGVRPSREVTS